MNDEMQEKDVNTMVNMLKMSLWLGCMLLMGNVVVAAALTPAQLLMAKQAGVDVNGLMQGSQPASRMPQAATIRADAPAADSAKHVNDVQQPSAIERHVWHRLNLQFDSDGKFVDQTNIDQTNIDQTNIDQTNIDQTNIDQTNIDQTNIAQTWDSWLEKKAGNADAQPIYQFGYDLFSGQVDTFKPLTEVPVPAEYVMGPGDELKLQFYGKKTDALYAMVDRTGMIEVPEIGAMQLIGLTFHEAKANIAEQIRHKSIGTTVSISMGQLRSMRVFVLGDARKPGSYMVSSLSTMSNALLASGGVSKQGSMRRILLKRQGKIISTLDLYDFLLRGDSSKDKRLLPGDVIYVAPIGKTITAFGEVNRPAIYELNHEKTVSDIVRMAGGLTAHADRSHEQIDRISALGGRVLVDLKPTSRTKVQAGDIVMIHAVPGVSENQIELLGQVKRPGNYGYVEGMRLNDVLKGKEDLLDQAYRGMALIQRTDVARGVVSVVRVPLADLFALKEKAAWPVLQARDKIYVFSQQVLNPLDRVQALGEFMKPGTYPLGENMSLLNLVLAAGGPTDSAFLNNVEITRYDVVAGERRVSRHIKVNVADVLAGKSHANIQLQAYDEVLIRKISQWKTTARVELTGEVMYPSLYPVEDGERLSSLLTRAGGFTKDAYLRGAVFSRASIRQEQQKAVDEMTMKMEAEIAQLEASIATLSDAKLMVSKQKSLSAAKSVVVQMRETKAQGRMVIKLEDIAALESSAFDLRLRDGDTLYIPKKPDQVLVMGQVYNTSALIFQEHLDLTDYVQASGGVTRMADESRTYVVRADGQVERAQSWGRTNIYPGDVIVVPEELEQFNLLDSTLDWSRALMQIGVGLASFRTIGIL